MAKVMAKPLEASSISLIRGKENAHYYVVALNQLHFYIFCPKSISISDPQAKIKGCQAKSWESITNSYGKIMDPQCSLSLAVMTAQPYQAKSKVVKQNHGTTSSLLKS